MTRRRASDTSSPVIKEEFIDHLLRRHPGLSARPRAFFEDKIADNLLSPFTVRLPRRTLDEIRGLAAAFAELRTALDRGPHRSELEAAGYGDPGNRSIMMSYDFHLDEDGRPKLIEVNTNAAFLILGTEMYRMHGLTPPVPYDEKSFADDVREELRLWSARSGVKAPERPLVTIIDEKPEEQRLYIEFVIAREWLLEQGLDADIRDVREALTEPRPAFIYNRSTDFLFQNPGQEALREAFRENAVCLSPNPHEYLLLADKQRLIEWTTPGFLESLKLSDSARERLKAALPESFDMATVGAEETWSRRKKLFFKPKREYGSKMAFKGASISRRAFDDLMKEKALAQEYVPAPERTFETPEGPQAFKFDLRCHAYHDRIESVIARLYQGQTTNLKSKYGGFAPVVFE